jgi:hypothetical protein
MITYKPISVSSDSRTGYRSTVTGKIIDVAKKNVDSIQNTGNINTGILTPIVDLIDEYYKEFNNEWLCISVDEYVNNVIGKVYSGSIYIHKDYSIEGVFEGSDYIMNIDKVFFDYQEITIFYKIHRMAKKSIEPSGYYSYNRCVITSKDIYAIIQETREKDFYHFRIDAEQLYTNYNAEDIDTGIFTPILDLIDEFYIETDKSLTFIAYQYSDVLGIIYCGNFSISKDYFVEGYFEGGEYIIEISNVFFDEQEITIFYKKIYNHADNSMNTSVNYRYYKCVLTSKNIYNFIYEYIADGSENIIISAELLGLTQI